MVEKRIGFKGLLFLLAAALAVIWSVAPGDAQSIRKKRGRDDVTGVARGEPLMEEAFRRARATLQEFLSLARSPRPTITSLAVKVPVSQRGETEYFWITPFWEEGDGFAGVIDNKPAYVRNVREGQTIRFKESDIADWLYREDGRMFGNFTLCAIARLQSPKVVERVREKYGLHCEQ
jgi:uncharacterized protein YegJ (DUF2314 family)